MSFEEQIIRLEKEKSDNKIDLIIGKKPVLLTSVHSMLQLKKDGSIKFAETFTKAI